MNESISAQSETTGASVGVGEVLGAAWTSFTSQLGTHVAFGLFWVLGLMTTMCGLTCCLAFPAGMMGSMREPGGSSDNIAGMIGFVLAFYGAMIFFMVAAMAFHHAGTVSVAVSGMRGRNVSVGDALRAGVQRIVPQSLFSLLRMLIDACIVFGVLLIPVAVAFGMRGAAGAGEGADSMSPVALGAIGLGYLVAILVVFASRGFTGLGPSVIAIESLGPIDALRRSSALLAGNRGAYYLAKLCVFSVGLATYLGFACVIFGAAGASMGGLESGSEQPNPMVTLILFPFLLIVYAILLAAYTFDHVVEAAFYVRLAKQPTNADDVASVFR